MRKQLAALTLLAATLTVTACGSSNHTTSTTTTQADATTTQAASTKTAGAPLPGVPATLVTRVEAICAHQDHALASTTSIVNEHDVTLAAQKHAAAEQAALTELTKLTVPTSSPLEPHWRLMLADKRTLVKAYRAIAHGGVSVSFTPGTQAQTQMIHEAEDLHLKACAQTE